MVKELLLVINWIGYVVCIVYYRCGQQLFYVLEMGKKLTSLLKIRFV